MDNIDTAVATEERNISVMGASGADGMIARLRLDSDGVIQDCDQVCESLFECRVGTLVGQHVAVLLPQLADVELLRNGEVNPQLRFLCRLGRRFQAIDGHGKSFATQLFLIVLDSAEHPQLSLIVRPVQDASDNRHWTSDEVSAIM